MTDAAPFYRTVSIFYFADSWSLLWFVQTMKDYQNHVHLQNSSGANAQLLMQGTGLWHASATSHMGYIPTIQSVNITNGKSQISRNEFPSCLFFQFLKELVCSGFYVLFRVWGRGGGTNWLVCKMCHNEMFSLFQYICLKTWIGYNINCAKMCKLRECLTLNYWHTCVHSTLKDLFQK